MPRDWKNDEVVIERHCTCQRVHWIDDDGKQRSTGHIADPDCPLHSPDPRFGLPPEFP